MTAAAIKSSSQCYNDVLIAATSGGTLTALLDDWAGMLYAATPQSTFDRTQPPHLVGPISTHTLIALIEMSRQLISALKKGV